MGCSVFRENLEHCGKNGVVGCVMLPVKAGGKCHVAWNDVARIRSAVSGRVVYSSIG